MLICDVRDERSCAGHGIFDNVIGALNLSTCALSIINCSGRNTILKLVYLTKILHRSLKAVHVAAAFPKVKSSANAQILYKIGFYQGAGTLHYLPFNSWA